MSMLDYRSSWHGERNLRRDCAFFFFLSLPCCRLDEPGLKKMDRKEKKKIINTSTEEDDE